MELNKIIYFDSAHKLNDYDGKCSRIHGHTWKVDVKINYYVYMFDIFSSDFNGILLDFVVIKSVIEKFDHLYLNDVININPTAENLASIICLMVTNFVLQRLKGLIDKKDVLNCFEVTIKLWESETSNIEVDNIEARYWLGLKEDESYQKFM